MPALQAAVLGARGREPEAPAYLPRGQQQLGSICSSRGLGALSDLASGVVKSWQQPVAPQEELAHVLGVRSVKPGHLQATGPPYHPTDHKVYSYWSGPHSLGSVESLSQFTG